MVLLKQSLRSFKMSNINPIFSIEYPNLDTMLYIRKQYPQMADMEIGTSIIDEECIIVHYLPADDKPVQIAEELIYFGTLLASTNHFHRTDDQYDLVYRCVNLRHEAKPERSADDEKIKVKIELPKFERVSQIEVKCDRNDVLTITYPRDETVFSNVDFEARSTYFDFQRSIADTIRDVLKEEFGGVPETRLFIGRNNVSFHIFDFTRFCIGGKAALEAVLSKINEVLLKPEHRGKVEAKEVKAPEELTMDDIFDYLINPKPATLGEVITKALKQGNSYLGTKPHTGFKPNDVVPLQGAEHSKCTSKHPGTGETVGYVDAAYDTELDQLSITYPLDKTVLSTFNLSNTDVGGWLENITSISDSVRTIIKMEYNLKAEVCSMVNDGKFKIYINDITRIAKYGLAIYNGRKSDKDIEGVIKHLVTKVNALVLKPEFFAKFKA